MLYRAQFTQVKLLVCVSIPASKTGGLKTYVHISTPLSWPDARDYCRENYKDLALIESEDENTNAYQAKNSSSTAWIGLYRVPWTWSDNSSSSFTNWRGGEPNGRNEYCVVETPEHLWVDVPCATEFSFICQEEYEYNLWALHS
uniref:C-type lectin domain-containing protein n=1 Tax=Labrus bergylta TaxID=56723 RepID=A0A3Q3FF36_9LABR